MTNYVKNLPPGVLKLIERIHFNQKHPENHNIKITNKKEGLIQVRRKNRLFLDNKMNVISNLLMDKYDLLEKHLDELNETDLTNMDNRIIERFRKNYENNEDYVKDMEKKIELLILNNSKLVG